MQVLLGHGGSLHTNSQYRPNTRRRGDRLVPTATRRAPQRFNRPRSSDLPGGEDPHAPLCWQRGVPAHTSASCGRAFSCPRSYGACASCPERCLRVEVGGGSLSKGARSRGRQPNAPRRWPHAQLSKVSSPTAQSGDHSISKVSSCTCVAAQTLPVPTPAAMMVSLAAPSPAAPGMAPGTVLGAQAQATPSSRGFRVRGPEGPGASAAGWAPKQDGAGLSSLPDPGPEAERHSPIARRRLERENAARHGPVCKT